MNQEELIALAVDAMGRAYAPYSRYQVGAALLTADGEVYTGCNIENGSYGATNCAERTAIFKAVSEGVRDFAAIAVVGGPDGVWDDYAVPCGICRQVMGEFCSGDFPVILATRKGARKVLTLDELLPERFVLHAEE